MEYLGIAAAWKKTEAFAAANPDTMTYAAIGAAVLLVFVIRWLIKK
ncbi:MAG: hypothetical protein R3229_13515 [Alphaproteobacteria bacterium]|nr:hypothetical protein [Alphaproteobacteria bacterium]